MLLLGIQRFSVRISFFVTFGFKLENSSAICRGFVLQ